ncbi:DUF2268 domain-containing protein [Flavihumibacter rivuli]|uniref:gliding motility protein GldB-related protein n=1 Tax=Flavihumibacter rivuli TaxID=2838156 RepID=UPI001BDDCF77|nr:DUF2268 domain-containing putative Zn-dependent protease [Flavihumibacter rivuli]ULQ56012.1 DUF2268 domain-containing protein [Flavihumibacter rivuli]
MRKTLLVIFLFCSIIRVFAQNTPSLNTPYFWLRDARNKVVARDTSGALQSIDNALNAGLFDLQAFTNSQTLTGAFSSEQHDHIRNRILANRSAIEKPSAIKVYTEDIDRFWNLFPSINHPDAEKIFLEEYILKGSKGLQTFYQIRMNSSLKQFIEKIRSIPSYYTSIRNASTQFKTMLPQFMAGAGKLEELYPASIFPPIYFLIGNLNNVGTADGFAGLLIGTEHLCRHSGVDSSELTPIDKMVLFDSSIAVPLILHEYVHFQQKNKPEKTLLDLCIMEGVADFITYLITGRYTNPEVYQYGFANEAAIWKNFTTEMTGENTDNWLFNTYNAQTGYPGNLGYFVGFRICESYYQQSADKKQAIRELMEIQDFNSILRLSKYPGGRIAH